MIIKTHVNSGDIKDFQTFKKSGKIKFNIIIHSYNPDFIIFLTRKFTNLYKYLLIYTS